MLARLSAFVIWALVAATAAFWGLRLLVRAPAAPAYAVPVGDAVAVRGDLTRLLGTAPVATAVAAAAPEASNRFRLLGIVAPKAGGASVGSAGHGLALIAVDGKMPRAYAVGARVDNDLILQSVSLRTASIAPSASAKPTITLELPPLVAAATGSLPLIGPGNAPGVPLPVPPYGPQPVPPQPLMVPQAMPGQAPPIPLPAGRPDAAAPTQ